MIAVDGKVIDTITKIEQFLEERKLTVENIPIDSIYTIIENTLGPSWWGCVGSKTNDAFLYVPALYRELIQKCAKAGDVEGCIKVLELFKNHYQCMYTALGDEEKIFREKPYRQTIIDQGNAYAEVQYRLHQERQKELKKTPKVLAEGRGVVYTCLLGALEQLYQPLDMDTHMDYICFTDQKEKWGTRQGVWQFREIENKENMDKKTLRYRYKIMAHEILEEYDYSVWVEHSMRIVGEVQSFINAYGNGNSFLGFPNSTKECLYKDISIPHMAMDDMNIALRRKIHQYKESGYPENNGLIDSRVMIRNHRDEELQKVMQCWWEEVKDFAIVGENCFTYAAWKNQFAYSICDLFLLSNPYFRNMDIELDTNEER